MKSFFIVLCLRCVYLWCSGSCLSQLAEDSKLANAQPAQKEIIVLISPPLGWFSKKNKKWTVKNESQWGLALCLLLFLELWVTNAHREIKYPRCFILNDKLSAVRCPLLWASQRKHWADPFCPYGVRRRRRRTEDARTSPQRILGHVVLRQSKVKTQ